MCVGTATWGAAFVVAARCVRNSLRVNRTFHFLYDLKLQPGYMGNWRRRLRGSLCTDAAHPRAGQVLPC